MKTIQVGPAYGENLRTLRIKYSLSQKALAKLSGISLPIVRLLEAGQITRELPEETLHRICAIFCCDPGQLTGTAEHSAFSS